VSKGSKFRPVQNQQAFDDNFDSIFNTVSAENSWQKYIAELSIKEPGRVFSEQEHNSFVKAYADSKKTNA
tara:strand:- start:325 stop:534 length:210 start_codon:yes stop_codon:yes gene_type:complete